MNEIYGKHAGIIFLDDYSFFPPKIGEIRVYVPTGTLVMTVGVHNSTVEIIGCHITNISFDDWNDEMKYISVDYIG